nr:protein IQ-DOMAIN 1-like [Ipomoea batatas]
MYTANGNMFSELFENEENEHLLEQLGYTKAQEERHFRGVVTLEKSAGTRKSRHRRRHSVEIDSDVIQSEFSHNDNASTSVEDFKVSSAPVAVGSPSCSHQLEDATQIQPSGDLYAGKHLLQKKLAALIPYPLTIFGIFRTLFLNLSFKVSKSSIPCFRPVAEKLAADTPLLTGQVIYSDEEQKFNKQFLYRVNYRALQSIIYIGAAKSCGCIGKEVEIEVGMHILEALRSALERNTSSSRSSNGSFQSSAVILHHHRTGTLEGFMGEDVASKAVNKISPPTSMLRMRLANTRSEEEA